MSLEERFLEAADKVKNLPKKPTDEELLQLYGLYKQGTIGDNETSKPGMFDVKAKYKWEAWNKLRGMTKDQAMEEYIQLVDQLCRDYSEDEEQHQQQHQEPF